MRHHYRVTPPPPNNRQDLNVAEESRMALLYLLDNGLLFLLTFTSFSIHYFPQASLPPGRSHVNKIFKFYLFLHLLAILGIETGASHMIPIILFKQALSLNLFFTFILIAQAILEPDLQHRVTMTYNSLYPFPK